MQSIDLVVSSNIKRTPRVMQLEGMFDCPAEEKINRHWKGKLPLDEKDWHVGLIVGPSGCGKSQILKKLFPDQQNEMCWGAPSVIDDFDRGLSMQDITSTCSAVGFNSIPSWMKPYAVLSNGEKFRVECARRLMETKGVIVIDEFTSVVDRQVAKIASNAIQKHVRSSNKKLVAASCHYDIEEWLDPDWILEPETMTFRWRSRRRRPQIDITIQRVKYEAWKKFAPYHYMSADLNKSSVCFGAFVGDEIVAFAGILHFPHPKTKNIKRVSRVVVLPDWQGLGLAFVLLENLGAAYKVLGYDFRMYPAHPSFVRSFDRSSNWACIKTPGNFSAKTSATGIVDSFGGRPCAVFRYCGDKDKMDKKTAEYLITS